MELGLNNIVTDESVIDGLLNSTTEESNETKEVIDPEVETKDLQEESKETDITYTDDPEVFLGADSNEETNKTDKTSSEEGELEQDDSPNVYSSLVKYLADSGTLTSLDDQSLNNIKSVEDLNELFEKEVQSRVEKSTEGVSKALQKGGEPEEVLTYKQSIDFLEKLDGSHIRDESDRGVKIRKALIAEDYLTKGFPPERAAREAEKSFRAGTDIEDALIALDSNREFYNNKYQEYLTSLDEKQKEEQLKSEKQRQELIKAIKEEEKLLGSLNVSQAVRDKIIKNMTEKRYVPELKAKVTPLEEYQSTNEAEFKKNVGILFTLTNGFKDLDSLIKSKSNRAYSKSIAQLENVLNNSRRTPEGLLDFSSSSEDEIEFKGLDLS